MNEVLPRSAKNLLEGKSGMVYRLFKRTEMMTDGSLYYRFNIKVPRLLFGWKWLKRNESWPRLKMEWKGEEEARAWIESHKKVIRSGSYEEVEL